MELHIFLAVLVAALLHASWNLLVKLDLDRFLALLLISCVMGLMGVAMLAFFPWPKAESYPYLLASGLLHTGYNIFLARSYRTGDLSQVYPIARGTAPLLTFIGAWGLAGETVTGLGALGILLLVSGIWLTARPGAKTIRLDGLTLFFALGTSAFIAAYTLVDGFGARLSGSASAYAGMLFVLDGLFMVIAALVTRGPRAFAQVLPSWKSGVTGALLSAGAYWIVIWAMSLAPVAAVAALRETSILFVMLMSAYFLKEKVTGFRLLGATLIVLGAVALRLA
ncbi:EamA family transporter [Nordella sp. HKS 07]|uniref:DMT family transporter n=1 Tax=Nordella sp. HKS 07 TaxID=2712222 RepID=UPI0013E1AE20|nr:DMT family transporter [Nordella sp. HKS 07]QIG48350.1 EamA family transporter [Nordella sp. HKS 07]